MSTDAPDATIHLRVARDRKNRWVQQAQSEGKKLTDWIIEKVERHDASQASQEPAKPSPGQ